MRLTETSAPPISAATRPKYGRRSTCGTSRASRSRDRGPCTASAPSSSLTVLDAHVQPPDAVGEPGEVGLGAGQQVLIGPRVQDDPVLDDEAALVEPARVLRAAGRGGADVAGQHAGEEGLGARAP